MTLELPLSRELAPSPQLKSYARIPEVLELPNLLDVQLDSFRWFKEEALRELFDEISPMLDFTGNRFELHFLEYEFHQPKYSEHDCREREMTYSAPLYVQAKLLVKETGEVKEQKLFFGDIPIMTESGTFIINGAERVVVSQLVRSPGIYFTLEEDVTSGRELGFAKLIPNRGAWLEFETSNRDVLSVKVDRKRKLSVTILLRALGFSRVELLKLFSDVDNNPDHGYIEATLKRDLLVGETYHKLEELKRAWERFRPEASFDKEAAKGQAAALIELHRRLRAGEPPTLDNATSLLYLLFFHPRHYDLGRVGRYKVNRQLNLQTPPSVRVLTKENLVELVRRLIRLNNGLEHGDDIDHLGNRRVRAVGELVQNQFRIGLLRMERVVRERMTLTDADTATPSVLVNIRPIVAAIREFFGGSQLSQFMDQTNPLAELTHKRRLSALGPGGLSRERASFDVRDVHHSHYGRICPIETPEGPNIGLLASLATYAHINEMGFIETPYRKVYRELANNSPTLVGRTLRERILDEKGRVIAKEGAEISLKLSQRLRQLPPCSIKIRPFVSEEIEYLSADKEEEHIIAQANSLLDAKNQFVADRVESRQGKTFLLESVNKVDYMDVAPKQVVSVSTALIPFLEHDDANRALMGSNMQRQAVPLLRPDPPLIGTGMEERVAYDSGHMLLAPYDGEVVSVNGKRIVLRDDKGKERVLPLTKFARSNQATCISQRPVVSRGQMVSKGQILAEGSATAEGVLSLGRNILCAFMSWEGYNFEDAIIISERMVREDFFTSIHIEKYECEARDTKLGPEEITRDIPNVGEESLKDMDEQGIVRIGAEVGAGDILVGKITPKGETELTAEEKLLRAIFGEKAREVKDTSLRVPHGGRGKVIDVKVFCRLGQEKQNPGATPTELPPGVNLLVRAWVAQRRRITAGDKMAGRHGNKGVVSRIMPVEDMPFLPDGTPVDMILNPIGVPSRMNLGQVLEAHLGWAAKASGFRVLSPVFDGADEPAIHDALARAWLAERAGALYKGPPGGASPLNREKAVAWLAQQGFDGEKVFSDEHPGEAKKVCLRLWLQGVGEDVSSLTDEQLEAKARDIEREKGQASPITGKTVLYDGRTGEPFDQPITVGYIYMMKLIHLAEDKMHARSTGPYSLITQQPLGGKAQFGGQRFGEMEVWALESYGAAYNLREMLTVKSDDVSGRVKAYEAVVKGEDISELGIPESFKVLVKELQSLGLAVEVLNEEEDRIPLIDESEGPRRFFEEG